MNEEITSEIIGMKVDGWGISKISRTIGVSEVTVRKYCNAYELTITQKKSEIEKEKKLSNVFGKIWDLKYKKLLEIGARDNEHLKLMRFDMIQELGNKGYISASDTLMLNILATTECFGTIFEEVKEKRISSRIKEKKLLGMWVKKNANKP